MKKGEILINRPKTHSRQINAGLGEGLASVGLTISTVQTEGNGVVERRRGEEKAIIATYCLSMRSAVVPM